MSRDKPLAHAIHQAHASSLAMARAVDNLGGNSIEDIVILVLPKYLGV
jgi:hypothetical protein